jgi:hypothetical protein
MFFREWCFDAARLQEIDTRKELIGIDHAELDKKEEERTLKTEGSGTLSTCRTSAPI